MEAINSFEMQTRQSTGDAIRPLLQSVLFPGDATDRTGPNSEVRPSRQFNRQFNIGFGNFYVAAYPLAANTGEGTHLSCSPLHHFPMNFNNIDELSASEIREIGALVDKPSRTMTDLSQSTHGCSVTGACDDCRITEKMIGDADADAALRGRLVERKSI